jgi:hypothetical protein
MFFHGFRLLSTTTFLILLSSTAASARPNLDILGYGGGGGVGPAGPGANFTYQCVLYHGLNQPACVHQGSSFLPEASSGQVELPDLIGMRCNSADGYTSISGFDLTVHHAGGTAGRAMNLGDLIELPYTKLVTSTLSPDENPFYNSRSIAAISQGMKVLQGQSYRIEFRHDPLYSGYTSIPHYYGSCTFDLEWVD